MSVAPEPGESAPVPAHKSTCDCTVVRGVSILLFSTSCLVVVCADAVMSPPGIASACALANIAAMFLVGGLAAAGREEPCTYVIWAGPVVWIPVQISEAGRSGDGAGPLHVLLTAQLTAFMVTIWVLCRGP